MSFVVTAASTPKTAPFNEATLPVFQPQARVPAAAPKNVNEAEENGKNCSKITDQRPGDDARGYGQGDSSCSELEPGEESIRHIINADKRKSSSATDEGCPLGILSSDGSLSGAHHGINRSGDQQGTSNVTMFNNRSCFASCYSMVSAASISSGGSTLVSEHTARSEDNDPSSVLDSSTNNNNDSYSSVGVARGNSVLNNVQGAKQNLVSVSNVRSEPNGALRQGRHHHDPLTRSVASEVSHETVALSITTDGGASTSSTTTVRIEVKHGEEANAQDDRSSHSRDQDAAQSLHSSNHLDSHLHVEEAGEIIKSSHLPSSLGAATPSVPYWKRGQSRVSPLRQLSGCEGVELLTAVSSPTNPICSKNCEDWRGFEDENGGSPLERTSLERKPTRGFLETNSRFGAEKDVCRYEAMFARTRSAIVVNSEPNLLPAGTRTTSDAGTQNSDVEAKRRPYLCRRPHRRDSSSLGVQCISEGDDEVELGDSSTTSPLLVMIDSRGRKVQNRQGPNYELQSSRSTLKPATTTTRRGSLSNSQANYCRSPHASISAPPPFAPTPPLAPQTCYVVGSSAPLVDVEPYSGCASVHSHHSSPSSPSPPMHYVCKSSNDSTPSLYATARGSETNLRRADTEREGNSAEGGDENAAERKNEKNRTSLQIILAPISSGKHNKSPNSCVCACHSACSSYHSCACTCCGHAQTVTISTAGNSNSVLGIGISSAVCSTSSNGNAPATHLRSSSSHVKYFQSPAHPATTASSGGIPISDGFTYPPSSLTPYVSPRGQFYGAFGYGSPQHGREEEGNTNASPRETTPALVSGDAGGYVARGRASSLSVLGTATIKKLPGTVIGTSPCHSPGSLAASTASEVSLAASPSPSQSPSSLLLSPFANLKRWVPTSDYEVFRAESAILSPIRPLISQFVCAGLNTISTVHPKLPRAEYESYENEKRKRSEQQEEKKEAGGGEGANANHPPPPALCPPPPLSLDEPSVCQTPLANVLLQGGVSEPHLMSEYGDKTHIIENFTFGSDPSPLSPDCRSLTHEHGNEEAEEVRGESHQPHPPPLTTSFASATRARAVSLASSSRDILNASGSAIVSFARRMTPHLGPAKPPIITSTTCTSEAPHTKNAYGDTAHYSYAHTYTCETPNRGSLFGDAGLSTRGGGDLGNFADGRISISKAENDANDDYNKLVNEERAAEINTSSFAWPTKFLSPGATPEASCLSPPSGLNNLVRSPIDDSIDAGTDTRPRALSLSTLFSRGGGGGGGVKGGGGDPPAARANSLSVSGQRQLLSPEGQHYQPQVPPMQSRALSPLPSDDFKIIVCVHGCYGGLGQWLPLWQEFAEKADVYAFDLPGFARSDRPSDTPFCGPSSSKNKSAQTAIDWFHAYFDRWFAAMKFPKKVTLIAHSFGGYLFALYSKKRPDLFEHVFLADPWGVRSYDPARDNAPLPRTVKALLWSFYTLESGMHTVIKAAGPIGPRLIPWVRPELGDSWGKTHSDGNTIYDYLYQCNANKQATGESGFRTCAVGPACPQIPLSTKLVEEEGTVHVKEEDFAASAHCERVNEGSPRNSQAFKLSWVFGMKSRFNNRDALDTHKALLAKGVSGTYDVVPDAGHQIMSDNPASLSAIVLHHMGLRPDPSRDEEALRIFVEEAVAECTKLCFKI